jgi:hypothetical protein
VIGAETLTTAVRRRLSADIVADWTGRPVEMDRQTGVPCARLTLRRIVMLRLPHGERPYLPLVSVPGQRL